MLCRPSWPIAERQHARHDLKVARRLTGRSAARPWTSAGDEGESLDAKMFRNQSVLKETLSRPLCWGSTPYRKVGVLEAEKEAYYRAYSE